MNLLKSRKFRQGSIATAFTILVIAFVVVVNMVVGLLSDRYALTLDLTDEKIFTLSDTTRDFLRDLDKDVTVYVLNSEETFTASGTYFVQANEVIKQYAQQSGRIDVQYVDIVRDPTFIAGYPDLQLTTGNILVEGPGGNTVLTAYDLFNVEYSYYGASITSSKAEQAMTSALVNVTSEEKILVSILNGYGGLEISFFTRLLEMNNFEVIEQNLLTEEVNPEASIAIIAAPNRDLEESDLQKLDRFLKNEEQYGKNLFFLQNFETVDTPNMNAFLNDWGVQVEPTVVYELDTNRTLQMVNGREFMILVDYAENEFSANAISNGTFPSTPYSRALTTTYENKGYRETSVLLASSSTSGTIPLLGDGEGAMGPIPTLMLTQEKRYINTTPVTSSVLVSGSSNIIEESILSHPSISNSEYLLDILGALAGQEKTIRIQDKTLGSTSLGITTNQALSISAFFTILFPLGVLIVGITLWLRRRHR